MGLGFTEGRPKIGSGRSTGPVSPLVAGVIEKGGSLAEVSMDHTSIIQPGDEVVAVGGAGGMLKYFKTDDLQSNGSFEGPLAEAIDAVAEPVRLQLERPLETPEVPYLLTFAPFRLAVLCISMNLGLPELKNDIDWLRALKLRSRFLTWLAKRNLA